MSVELLIFSDIRFIREGLADAFGRHGAFRITGTAMNLEQACTLARSSPPRVILLDTALADGVSAVGRLRACVHDAKIVAFALTETEAEVIAWAQAGISGYIPRDASLTAIVGLLNSIVGGEQVCQTRIASGMLRWIAQHSGSLARGEPESAPQVELTTREQEVAHLMSASLSNKEIARRLGISLATTKTHVHNILSKLRVSKRALAAQRLRRLAARHSPAFTTPTVNPQS